MDSHDGQGGRAQRQSLQTLARSAETARRMARAAMARGDWDVAADFEERALLTEHRAGLLEQELASHGEPRPN